MTTTIAALPFFGGEMSSFDTTSALVGETTAGGTFNSSFSRCSILLQDQVSTMTTPSWPSASAFWLHFLGTGSYGNAFGTANTIATFYSGATIVAKLIFTLSGLTNVTVTAQTLQGGSLTTVSGSGSVTYNGTLSTIDVNLVAGASGSIAVYGQGTLMFSASSLNHAGFSGVTSVTFAGLTDGGFVRFNYMSQIICDTTSTVGRYLLTDNFDTESGVNTGWTGAGGASKLADINEIVTTDTTYIYAGSTGLTDTFYQSGLSYGTYTVLARGVSARARVQGAGPANIKLAVRVSGANYVSAAIGVNAGYQACFNSWATNPATSSAWNASAAASAEVGVQSLT